MGLSESKLVADTLSEACRKAENTGMIDVTALLSKKEDWSQNPSSFFKDESLRLDLESSPVAEAYLCLQQLGRREEVDIIRARLLKIVFSRLKERLCLHYMRSNDVDDMAKIILKSGLVQSESDKVKVKGNIIRLIDQGGRIDAFCRSIGGSSTNEDWHLGNLFCLPQDYHDEFIRLLGYTGPEREQQIQRIKDRGILNLQNRATLDIVAASVFGFLWTKIEVSINDIVVETPESVLVSVSSRRQSQEQSVSRPNDETGQPTRDFVLGNNSHQLLPEIFGSRDEGAITNTGSIFNIHENPQTMLPGSFELQNEAAIMSMQRVFNIHANSQMMLHGPFDLQGEAAITGTGSIFNIHENPQTMLPDSFELQNEAPIMSMERVFNIHANSQIRLPGPFDPQGEADLTSPESIFNMHEQPQTTLAVESARLQDEQAMMVAEVSINSSTDLQSHHSQYRTSVPLTATHSDYRQNHSDQAPTPDLVT
ncbi:hypothetical protein N7523_010069 [Penicillium sp. IBT 18751x]|nr:hypothetical protein N7523_010069 [Penicillium sp. IBT 18751x]